MSSPVRASQYPSTSLAPPISPPHHDSDSSADEEEDEDADEFYDPQEYDHQAHKQHHTQTQTQTHTQQANNTSIIVTAPETQSSNAQQTHIQQQSDADPSTRSTRSQSSASQSSTGSGVEPASPSPGPTTTHTSKPNSTAGSTQQPHPQTSQSSASPMLPPRPAKTPTISTALSHHIHQSNHNRAGASGSTPSSSPVPTPSPADSSASASSKAHPQLQEQPKGHIRSSSFTLSTSPFSSASAGATTTTSASAAASAGVISPSSSSHSISSSANSQRNDSQQSKGQQSSPKLPASSSFTSAQLLSALTSPTAQPRQPSAANHAVTTGVTIRNLDTDESCSLDAAPVLFPETAAALTIAQLEALEEKKKAGALALASSSPAISAIATGKDDTSGDHVEQKISQGEITEGRKSLGFLSRLAKSFSLSSSFSSSSTINKPIDHKVKVKSKHCEVDVLSDLMHVQTVQLHLGPIWCVCASVDGQYIATGGQDSVVRVWAIMGGTGAKQMEQKRADAEIEKGVVHSPYNTATPAPNAASGTTATASDYSADEHNERPYTIVWPEPCRIYSGHRADVTALDWSKDENFLLSASIDKTVRLWHVSSSRCIRVFPHTDIITSIAFHPIQHRYFLSGSFDNRIRLWNILEHRVVEWAQTAHFVTAVCFSPNGHMAVAGLHHGQCVFYQTQGLKYYTQIDCRNRSGKHKKGKKITGLQYSKDGKLLLITTNDSRIRCYRMIDFSCVSKMKGLENEQLQIKASFNEDNTHVIMGSDKEYVGVWKMPVLTTISTTTTSATANTATQENERSKSSVSHTSSSQHRTGDSSHKQSPPTSAPLSPGQQQQGSPSSSSSSSISGMNALSPSSNMLSPSSTASAASPSPLPASSSFTLSPANATGITTSTTNVAAVLSSSSTINQKTDAFEYFKSLDDTVTCAIFLPRSSIAFSCSGESAIALPVRNIVVCSGLNGELKFYANRLPKPNYPMQQHMYK